MKLILYLMLAVFATGINAIKEVHVFEEVGVHPSHHLAHELFRRQATSEEDCTIDDCMVDDGCITEESYLAGTVDCCYVETLQIGFTESEKSVCEDAGMVTLTIQLNEAAWATEPVTVLYSTSQAAGDTNQATSGDDYSSVNGEVVFAIGETSKQIHVPILENEPVGEPDERFLVELTTKCCAEITTGIAAVIIRECNGPQMVGDPHFTVPLLSQQLLCYSIQGYSGLVFNLISNSHITINAMFIDSIEDMSEATWIGKMAIIPHDSNEEYQTIEFDSVSQNVIIEKQGQFNAAVVKEVHIHGHNNISVKLTRGMAKQVGNPVVRVIYTKPLASFDVTFHRNHLDVDWKIHDEMIQNSHGLMGQFMVKGIEIDTVKKMLIRPGFESVPVESSDTWAYNEGQTTRPCWKAMNVGHQGEGLIEGNILDYIVDGILEKDYVFKKN